ncbi:hypothetical protein D3C81_1281150 [compost metagenome]
MALLNYTISCTAQRINGFTQSFCPLSNREQGWNRHRFEARTVNVTQLREILIR